MVLLEAFALKRPVIASRVGGIPEVVSHGHSGILVSPGNHEELAAAISKMIKDPARAEALGIAGQRQVEDNFSASLMADRTAGIYRSLCEGKLGLLVR